MAMLAESVDGVIGVDTHRDTLTAAAVTAVGGLLGQLVVVWASTPPTWVTAAAARVSRWGSTPMTPSTSSASMAMRWSSWCGGGRSRRRPGRSHRAAQL